MSNEEINNLKLPELKTLCREYKLNVSGKKSELCERILAHHLKIQQKEQRLVYGEEIMRLPDGSVDEKFEAVMKKFFDWCEKNHFAPHEIAEGGYSFKKVDWREIRASFKEYDPAASTLRKDKFVAVPQNQMEVFLEMFFDRFGGDWEMFEVNSGESADQAEVVFDESVEERFIKEMKENPANQGPQWCATDYATKRD